MLKIAESYFLTAQCVALAEQTLRLLTDLLNSLSAARAAERGDYDRSYRRDFPDEWECEVTRRLPTKPCPAGTASPAGARSPLLP